MSTGVRVKLYRNGKNIVRNTESATAARALHTRLKKLPHLRKTRKLNQNTGQERDESTEAPPFPHQRPIRKNIHKNHVQLLREFINCLYHDKNVNPNGFISTKPQIKQNIKQLRVTQQNSDNVEIFKTIRGLICTNHNNKHSVTVLSKI